MNATIAKFGYPETLIRDYEHWVLMLRPSQVTAGSLILAAKSEATAYGDLPEAAFNEQGAIIKEVEELLRSAIKPDKINYLMLMMVDPHVHFHIFPRYQGDRSIAGLVLTDHGWPGPPDLKSAVDLNSAAIGRAVEALR
ncbi:MAG: HIT family protein [Sphingomicrobium sp.]